MAGQTTTTVTKKTPVKASGAAQKQPTLTVISKVIKGDTYMVMADAAREIEDEFSNLYFAGAGSSGYANLAITPPYNPKMLKSLVTHNNVLNQCIQAMEINIDGTGFEFVGIDEDSKPDQKEVDQATEFFAEPYPGKSFVSLRRQLRQDLESMGWGFIEVLRNLAGDLMALRTVEGQTMRLVRLGDQMELPFKMERGGQEIELKIRERPRRFMQVVGSGAGSINRQYFKEFGCPLDLNRRNGDWAPLGTKLKPEDQATEVLYFGVDKDANSPYFVPRWINHLPSVLGSRKAEEANLEFLDAGGMPPAIIFIQGGSMVGQTANDLRTYLSNSNRKHGRAVVVELASNSGSLEGSAGTVSAKVERFGSERMNDGMYQKYDVACGEHIRRGFRLPPLFVGDAASHNYATAVASYQIAEAQVFQPERHEFDEILNKTVMKAMGFKTIKFKSKPISLKSVEETFQGMTLLDGKIEDQDFVQEVNKTLGMDLKYKEPPPEPVVPVGHTDPHTGLPFKEPVNPIQAAQVGLHVVPGGKKDKGSPKVPPVKPGSSSPQGAGSIKFREITPLEVIKLARRYAEIERLCEPLVEMTEFEQQEVRETVQKLDEPTLARFEQMVEVFALPADGQHQH